MNLLTGGMTALGSAHALRAMAGPRDVTASPKAGRKHR